MPALDLEFYSAALVKRNIERIAVLCQSGWNEAEIERECQACGQRTSEGERLVRGVMVWTLGEIFHPDRFYRYREPQRSAADPRAFATV